MRGMLKLSMVMALALGLASVAQAQRPRGFAGPGAILTNPGVQKELKLTDDQVGKLKDALEKVRDNHKDDLPKLREMSREDRQKLMNAIRDESDKAIAGVLDAKQLKRFHQIRMQLVGVRSFNDARVEKALKLSDSQKKKLRTIFEDADKKMQELFQGGNVEGAREKFQDIRKQTQEKATGVLTDEQKKSWKELKGQPFEFQRPGRG